MTSSDERQHELTWRAHPARERPGPALLAGAVVAAMAGMSGVLMQNPWWGGFAGLVMMVALNRFFLPSRFAIDDDGITAHYPLARRSLRWAELRRLGVGAQGIFLSTRARPSWLDGRRALHVLFGGDREAVVAGVRDHVSPALAARLETAAADPRKLASGGRSWVQ